MNEKRMAVVKHAFQVLDQTGNKKLDFQKLCQRYNAEAHPRVRTREKRAETVMNDFVELMG